MRKKKLSLAISILIISINMMACNSSDVNNPKVPNPPIENGEAINKVDKTPPKADNRSLNKDKEEVFNYEGGNYSVKFIDARKYTNINNTSSMNNWVTVEYAYKNVNMDKGIEVKPESFEVKDQGNTVLEFASMYEEEAIPKELKKGEEKTVKMVYKAEKPVTKLTITFKGLENKNSLGSIELPVNN